jgi:hypothetical protein
LTHDTASWTTGSPANHELGLVKELEDTLKAFTGKPWKEDSDPPDKPESKLRVEAHPEAKDIVEQHGLILREY